MNLWLVNKKIIIQLDGSTYFSKDFKNNLSDKVVIFFN